MDLKSAINIILGDLREASDLMEDLRNKPEFPELQIELARSKCRSASDLIMILGDILAGMKLEPLGGEGLVSENKDKEDTSHKQEHIPERQDENSWQQPADTEKLAATERQQSGGAEKEDGIAGQQSGGAEHHDATERQQAGGVEKEDGPVKLSEEVSEGEEAGTEEIQENKEESTEKKADQIIADRFAHLSNRMNEKVGSGKITGKARTIPVTDLNRALGINDRFYFIRELFNGNADSFRQTVSNLNQASSTEEARDILSKDLKGRADSKAALQLLELVERKLPAK